MKTHKIPLCYSNQRDPYNASRPGVINNPHWLELPLSRTNFHGPKDVRAIEVPLYLDILAFVLIQDFFCTHSRFMTKCLYMIYTNSVW